jgi:hypothetical protein
MMLATRTTIALDDEFRGCLLWADAQFDLALSSMFIGGGVLNAVGALGSSASAASRASKRVAGSQLWALRFWVFRCGVVLHRQVLGTLSTVGI